MNKINTTRVIIGGLVAGLVISAGEFILNDPILGKEWEAAMVALGKPPFTGTMAAVFFALGFLVGIVMVWIYAAIRPRYGMGPRTAIWAGLITWLLASFYSGVGAIASGMFPSRLIAISMMWGLVELPLAAVAGAWFYREEI